MKWTVDQKKVLDSRNCNLLVSAAAGSGKTAVLVERIIQMICDKDAPINIDQLLVVTFTKAAASQMKDKIRKAIEDKIELEPENQHFQQQLLLLGHANILTIDSFCYKVVKEHFSVLGIDPMIRIGEAGEIGLLRNEVLEEVIEKFYEKDSNFIDFSEAFCGDKSDERLEEYIGKIYDISSSYPKPEQWITLAKKNLCVSTEEDFVKLPCVQEYFKQVHENATYIREVILEALEIARGLDGPVYMEKALLSDIQLVEDIISARTYSMFHELYGWKFANIGRGKSGTFHPELAEKIKADRERYKKQIKNLLKAFLLPFSAVQEQLTKQAPMLDALLDAAAVFRERFLDEKKKHNLLEFSDVEHFAFEILCDGLDEKNNPVLSKIGLEMQDDFYEIMIDEYQDSNYLQEAILSCVSKMSRGSYNIFMVGDVKQSIYSFRMARPDLFMEKYHRYLPEENCRERKLLLKNNFRSRRDVLEGINYIFYQIMGEDLGGIAYNQDEALVPSAVFPGNTDNGVELLLGESKAFDFISQEHADVSAKKEEDLDDILEDVGKVELEATIIAKRIQKLFGKEGNSRFQVTDSVTGMLRDITYKDIVILLRSPAGYGPVFWEVLSGYGIPVRMQNEMGYLNTTEILQVLSLMKALDNPHNEVEMMAALRGFFGGFRDDELAKLVILKRELEKEHGQTYSIYQTLKNIAMDGKQELYEKCKAVMELFQELMDKIRYSSLTELLQFIYYETGFYYYVQAMPEGAGRTRNLKLFGDEAAAFEKTAYRSLFEFLQYISGVMEKSITLGGDSSVECEDDVVRIMSIHKSKGLEFPVVFLSGMGKKFNLRDARTALIVHPDYFLGAKYINTRKRCGNDTFIRQIFGELMRTESIAEELRILYVGLTRAKDKLIMTGVTPDIPALVHQFDSVMNKGDIPLGFPVIWGTTCYLDMVVAAFIRNRTFQEAMEKVRKRLDSRGEGMVSAQYSPAHYIEEPDFSLLVEVYDYENLAIYHIVRGAEEELGRLKRWEAFGQRESENQDKIETYLTWRYPNEDYIYQKSKLSVTEIKRIYERDFIPSDFLEAEPVFDSHYVFPVPDFMQNKKTLDAAQRGTLVHKAMELFDFSYIDSKEKAKEWLENIIMEERLPADIKRILTIDKIDRLLESDLGKRMCNAAKKGLLYKEKRFVIGVPPERIIPNLEGEDGDIPIVVQGIIDAYFEEDGKIILLDYKTDSVKDEGELIKRYTTQLQYYKGTLEQLLNCNVAETYLYSFSLGKEILLF